MNAEGENQSHNWISNTRKSNSFEGHKIISHNILKLEVTLDPPRQRDFKLVLIAESLLFPKLKFFSTFHIKNKIEVQPPYLS